MRRFSFLFSFILLTTSLAQAQEATDAATDTNAASTDAATDTDTAQNAVAAQEPTITISKSDLQALVQQMVADELAKKEKEAEQAAVAKTIVPETAADAASESHEAINDTRDDMVGLILPELTKTGITFIMGDDNLMDNSQYSVAWDIGQRPEYEDFFERVYGYSNTSSASTRLSIYHKEVSRYNPYLSAAMSLNFKMVNKMDNIDDNLTTAIYEDQSYIDLQYYKPNSHKVKLTLYPYNADSIAIGYMRGLRWGTRDAYPQISKSVAIPGFQLLYGYKGISAYVALKTHAQEIKDKLNTEFVPKETTVSLFAGVSMKLDNGLSGHLQFAFIDKGENAKIDDKLLGENHEKDDQIYSYGVDAFLQYELGSTIGDPIGINAYANRQWISPDYTSNNAFRARVEYIFAIERLMNADYLSTDTKTIAPITALFPAHGVAADLAYRHRKFRLFGNVTMRTLSFLTFDCPGVNPFETLSANSSNRPETQFSLHADYNVKMLWFGLGLGYKIPSTYTVKDASGQEIVTVVKDRITSDTISYAFDRTREVLPAGEKAKNMWFIKADIKAEITKSVSAGLEYSFTRDLNRAKLMEKLDSTGLGTGLFVSTWDDKKVQNIHSLVFSVEGRF